MYRSSDLAEVRELCVARHPHSPDESLAWLAVHRLLREIEPFPATAASPVCPICHNVIVKDAHGGPHPSPGDHDPAYHVAANYGTWHPSLGPR